MENLRPIFSGLAGAVISSMLVAWASRASSERSATGLIHYGWRIRCVAVLMMAIALFIGYAALHASPNQRLLAYGIGGVSLAFAGWFAVEVLFVRAQVSETHLCHWSPWRGRRSIPWSAITGYAYSQANSWHVLSTEGYGRVRLSVFMTGVDQVVPHLPWHREDTG